MAVFALGIYMIRAQQRARQERLLAEIESRLDAIRAAGEPVSLADYAKLFPDPPPEHDASRLLAEVFSRISIPKPTPQVPFFSDAKSLIGSGPMSEVMKAGIQRLLETNQSALSAVREIEIKNAWFKSGFSGGITNLSAPSIRKLTPLVRLLCLSAIYEAETGRTHEAVRSIELSFQAGRTLRSDTFVHHFMRRSHETLSCAALERVCNRTSLDETFLCSISELLKDEASDGLRGVLLNERCLTIELFGLFRTTMTQIVKNTSLPLRPVAGYCAGKLFRMEDFLLGLHYGGQIINGTRFPFQQRLSMANDIKAQWNQSKSKSGAFSQMAVSGDWTRMILIDADVIAKLRTARTALAIERWRLAHEGRPPESLAQLVPDFLPDVPMDPFDEQPLRYRKLDRGHVVYSVGPDFTDDGGLEKPANATESTAYDITFTVER
jgi:hypothetical protein